jgi:hypothetical protein
MLKKEFNILKDLDHPGIVKVYSLEQKAGYNIMEL